MTISFEHDEEAQYQEADVEQVEHLLDDDRPKKVMSRHVFMCQFRQEPGDALHHIEDTSTRFLAMMEALEEWKSLSSHKRRQLFEEWLSGDRANSGFVQEGRCSSALRGCDPRHAFFCGTRVGMGDADPSPEDLDRIFEEGGIGRGLYEAGKIVGSEWKRKSDRRCPRIRELLQRLK